MKYIQLKKSTRGINKHRTNIRNAQSFDEISDQATYDKYARNQQEYKLTCLSLAELGFPNGATGEQILAKLKEEEYELFSIN